MTIVQPSVRWRAAGQYLPTSVLKPSLLDETRQFLLLLAQNRDVDSTYKVLLDGGLPQRSRATRLTAVKTIRARLVGWHPPAWVLDDLVAFAQDGHQPGLEAALLMHVVRQDTLLYDFAQEVVVPRWRSGERMVVRADVQQFLDRAQQTHPEIDGWSRETREKLAGNALTILRDYGLLRGSVRGSPQKQIVEPTVPPSVAEHLIRLLLAEGIARGALAEHPDWRVWLWDSERARAAVDSFLDKEAP